MGKRRPHAFGVTVTPHIIYVRGNAIGAGPFGSVVSLGSANVINLRDTALIWYFVGSKYLKKEIKERIDETRNSGGRLLIPTIVLSEALDVAEKNKVVFDFEKMYKLIKTEPEFDVVGFSQEIFEETLHTKHIADIHDRIIVATARFYNAGIMTKDKIVLESLK